MIKFINTLLIAATSFAVPYADEALAIIYAGYAVYFYYIMILVYTTLSQVVDQSHDRAFLIDSSLGFAIHTIALIMLWFMTPYTFVAWFALPWVVSNICTLIFNWLVNLGILELDDE